jgi:hypothetical protein
MGNFCFINKIVRLLLIKIFIIHAVVIMGQFILTSEGNNLIKLVLLILKITKLWLLLLRIGFRIELIVYFLSNFPLILNLLHLISSFQNFLGFFII